MIFLRKPSDHAIHAFLERQTRQTFSYAEQHQTRDGAMPPGYNHDRNRIRVGTGEADFIAACAALRQWQMFRLEWVAICNAGVPIRSGTNVAMLAKCFGIWWLNACRIVYVIDEPGAVRKFGFAYGTLAEHVERGEERFLIEWNQNDDSVWYDLSAFSRPAFWMVKLGYPMARRLQRKFAQQSLAAMKRAVENSRKAIA
jgi:uncharacterized protein (UPF0548 family)